MVLACSLAHKQLKSCFTQITVNCTESKRKISILRNEYLHATRSISERGVHWVPFIWSTKVPCLKSKFPGQISISPLSKNFRIYVKINITISFLNKGGPCMFFVRASSAFHCVVLHYGEMVSPRPNIVIKYYQSVNRCTYGTMVPAFSHSNFTDFSSIFFSFFQSFFQKIPRVVLYRLSIGSNCWYGLFSQ